VNSLCDEQVILYIFLGKKLLVYISWPAQFEAEC